MIRSRREDRRIIRYRCGRARIGSFRREEDGLVRQTSSSMLQLSALNEHFFPAFVAELRCSGLGFPESGNCTIL